jgi:hypothetical protein
LSDDEIIQRACAFVKHVKRVIEEYDVSPQNIFNMDETVIFIENGDSTTVDRVGSRKVAVLSANLTRFKIQAFARQQLVGGNFFQPSLQKVETSR